MFKCKLAVALLLVACGASPSFAQVKPSKYTNSLLRKYSNSSSAAGYSAQRQRSNVLARSLPQYNYTPMHQNTINPWSNSSASKPFSNMNRGPTVSPWLSMSNPYSSSASNYYTQVRPALEQQRLNQQVQQRDAMVQKQLNDLTVPPPYEPTGDMDRAPTGHPTVYMNNYGYYPQPQQQQRR